MKSAEQKFLKELDDKLWKAADRLRNNLDAANYKHVVLGIIFLKYVSDAFEERRNELRKLPATRAKLRGQVTDYLGNWHASNRSVGLPSDDTQMAFWTIESILECGSVNPVDLVEKFSTRQIYGRGQSVGEFVRNYQRNMEWPEASSRSAGNGALMRIAAVLAAHKKGPSTDLWSDTVLCAAVTHNDAASISACVAFVGILRANLVAGA